MKTTVPGFLQLREGRVFLAIKLQPRAASNQIGEVLGNELKIKVTAPPVDSAANEALVRFLAEKLDCPRGAVHLVRGQTSRHKIISLQGMSAADIVAKLIGSPSAP